jgi:hypothetical protein
MSATSSGPDEAAHRYFQALEEEFLRLRGVAGLLSANDWRLAAGWQEAGIPLDLVLATLRDLWQRRLDRGGTRRRINSLRYFAPAVEAAWEEFRALLGPGHGAVAPVLISVSERLDRLAARLPATLPNVEAWRTRLRALQGDAYAVEAQLASFDRELLDELRQALTEDERARLDQAATSRLAALRGRLHADQAAESQRRLAEQILRTRGGLPVLSLFAPEALAEPDPG